MGKVEIFINEEGALKVVQHYDLRVLLRRLRLQSFERHRVFKWPNCSWLYKNVQEDELNRTLKVFFIIILSWCFISLIIQHYLTYRHPIFECSLWHHILQIGWTGLIILALFAAVLAVCVSVEKMTKSAGSATPRSQEVQTISALVQQV